MMITRQGLESMLENKVISIMEQFWLNLNASFNWLALKKNLKVMKSKLLYTTPEPIRPGNITSATSEKNLALCVPLMQLNTLTNKVASSRSRLILVLVKIRENPRDYSNYSMSYRCPWTPQANYLNSARFLPSTQLFKMHRN